LFQVWFGRRGAASAVIQGKDFFTRWAEAILIRPLSSSDPAGRAAAYAAVVDVLNGALEAVLPAARCTKPLGKREILARACDGWSVAARAGVVEGDDDVIDVRGPLPVR
jgi:hypothetical protein